MWQWQHLQPGPGASWQALAADEAVGTASDSTASAYLPTSQDVGLVLRARVTSYTDGHGPGKQAASGETAAVVGTPKVPRKFTATPGNRQVTLRWEAPSSDGGSPLVRYETWPHPADGGGTTWQPVGGGSSARRQKT